MIGTRASRHQTLAATGRRRPVTFVASLAVAALAVLGGCTGSSDSTEERGAAPAGSGEQGAAGETAAPPSADGLAGTVVRVVDGDTVEINLSGGETERVRLLGIDTPETVKPDSPVECYGPEASARAHELLAPGTEIIAQRDLEARDRFGRLLLYLWRADDGVFVNEAMVADGFARTLSIEPNVAYRRLLADRQADARRRGDGLWGTCPTEGDQG